MLLFLIIFSGIERYGSYLNATKPYALNLLEKLALKVETTTERVLWQVLIFGEYL